MKTLYVSDLDGTLLNQEEKTSEYTNQVINDLVEKGMLFSYATARSLNTSHKVTAGLSAKMPLIVYNGAFVVDNVTNEILVANYFEDDVQSLLDDLFNADIYPIVYGYVDGVEKFSYIKEKNTEGMKRFIASRADDKRDHPVSSIEELIKGNLFYITCIDEKEKLLPFYEKYKEQYHCVYQEDIYTKDQWLEMMPLSASKSHAIKQLKAYYGCDYVVAFGDGRNDIDMFEMADESYAVSNAVNELKAIATDVIESNDENGVAKWLIENYK